MLASLLEYLPEKVKARNTQGRLESTLSSIPLNKCAEFRLKLRAQCLCVPGSAYT